MHMRKQNALISLHIQKEQCNIFLIPNFKPLAIFCGCTAQYESVVVCQPDDRFVHDAAHLSVTTVLNINTHSNYSIFTVYLYILLIFLLSFDGTIKFWFYPFLVTAYVFSREEGRRNGYQTSRRKSMHGCSTVRMGSSAHACVIFPNMFTQVLLPNINLRLLTSI